MTEQVKLKASGYDTKSLEPGSVSTKEFLFGTPIKTASRKQQNMAYSMMMYMMGTMAAMTCSRVKIFHDDLATHPDLYRQKVKHNTSKALASCDRLTKAFLHLAAIDRLEESWPNITKRMEESMAVDMMKLYFTLDNEVCRAKYEPHTVITNFAIAHKLSQQLVETAKAFGKFLYNEMDMGENVELSQKLTIPINGIYNYLTAMVPDIITERGCNDIAFAHPAVQAGFKVIAEKTLSFEHLTRALTIECDENNINIGKEEGEELHDNRGAAWNAAQDRTLVNDYGIVPDEVLARDLGRTTAAIRARARKLGVRKKKSNQQKRKKL